MGDGKKTLVIIVLIVVIIAAATWVLRKGSGPAKPPAEVLARKRLLVDVTDGQLIERTEGEWRELGQRDGKYKNPDTGQYTMTTPVKCASCGEWVPPVDLPARAAGGADLPPDAARRASDGSIMEDPRDAAMKAYRCPKCKGPVYEKAPR